jgi:hypothetical protein
MSVAERRDITLLDFMNNDNLIKKEAEIVSKETEKSKSKSKSRIMCTKCANKSDIDYNGCSAGFGVCLICKNSKILIRVKGLQ